MIVLNIASIPNQSFNFIVSGELYEFRMRFWNDLFYITLYISGKLVMSSQRCIVGKWIIPHEYISVDGNFRFEQPNENKYMKYEDFGKKTFLKFYTASEISEINQSRDSI